MTHNCRHHSVLSLAAAVVVSLSSIVAGCNGSGSPAAGEHRHKESLPQDFERGPHGGRMLRDGNFSVEISIFETGTPPHFRVYAYSHDQPVGPSEFSAQIELTRLGGRTDSFDLIPLGDFRWLPKEVSEPHSFDVLVKASFQGVEYSWSYASPEGRTTLSPEVAKISGVVVERAGVREIKTTRHIRGKVLPSEHRIAHIIPRFSGVVREGRKHIGDKVEKGEVLAVIESNQSLQPFEVRSQIAGTVINGHLIVGEFVPENQWVYIVADLSEVWVDLFVPLAERLGVQAGQEVTIHAQSTGKSFAGSISYVAPYADEKSQSQLVRAVISNRDGELLPGTFVAADLLIGKTASSVVIRRTAVQRMGANNVVFVRVGDIYEARPVTLGNEDEDWVEVHGGLYPDEEYVSGNSFLIKADILKSGASHDH